MSAERALAQAVHRRALSVTNVHGAAGMVLATVRRLRPLQMELHGAAATLTAPDDVMLSQFVRWFDANYGLQPGDVLALIDAADGWLAFDVISERDVTAGIRPGKTSTDPDGAVEPIEPSSEAGLLSVQTAVNVPTNPDGTVSGPASATSTVTWGQHIGHKLEVRDTDGTLIGYVPVFTDLP